MSPETGMVAVYPNPVTAQLYWKLGNNVDGFVEVKIFDLQGTMRNHFQGKSTRDQVVIGDLAAGIYWVEFAGEGFCIRRIILKK
jgi:hypothetical protein